MCSERQAPGPRPTRGFTLIELVMVMVLVAVLAAVAVPRLNFASAMGGLLWRDQVVNALRHARTVADGHRRVVCIDVSTAAVDLKLAAANPAVNCTVPVAAPDAGTHWANGSGHTTTVSPAGTMYMQPDGRITADLDGTTPAAVTIGIAGEADISVVGTTGHVE